jgi:dTDP-4-amino-4,6-dideoxygalactose transaminase
MDGIMALARRYGLTVIEDACQAHGAWIGGRRAGSIGDAGCFSFYPAKNLGAWGDAGGLVTGDPHIADRVRLLRSHGERPRYHHLVPGTTARLDTIQAAVLRVKLPRLDAVNEARRRVAAALTVALRGGVVRTPAPVRSGEDHVFHQYVVLTDDREALRAHLQERGIATAVHYPTPVHRTEAYAGLPGGVPHLPVAEGLAPRICSLPMHARMTSADVDDIAAAVRELEPVAA